MPQSRYRMQLAPADKVPPDATPPARVQHWLIDDNTLRRALRRRNSRPFGAESSSSMAAISSRRTKPGRKSGCNRPSRKRHFSRGSFKSLRRFTTIRGAIFAARSRCYRPASGDWRASRTRTEGSRWALSAQKHKHGWSRWLAVSFRRQRSLSRELNLQKTFERDKPYLRARAETQKIPGKKRALPDIAARYCG
jgi:hypothetical protein